MKKDASALLVLVIIAALSFLAPSEPVEPEPPAVVETIQAKALPDKLKAAAGVACIAVPACLGVRLARRKRKDIVTTDSAQFALLMKRLNDMAAILEATEKAIESPVSHF